MDTTDDANDVIEPNDAQARVIDSDHYPMRVLAGAGTGKTFTMVQKIKRLLVEEEVPPDDILALTFTNKAAESMRTKLAEEVGEVAYDIDAYTYHAISHEILTEYAYYQGLDPDYDIASDLDRFKFVYDVLEQLPYDFIDPEVRLPDDEVRYQAGVEGELRDFISELKSAGITPDTVSAYMPSPTQLASFEAILDDLEAVAEARVRIHWRTAQSMNEEKLRDLLAELAVFRRRIVRHREQLDGAAIVGQFREMLGALVTICDRLETLLLDRRDEMFDGEQGYGKLPGYLFGTYSDGTKGVPELDILPIEQIREAVRSWQHASDLVAGYRGYEQRLDSKGLLDFDDLVRHTLELLDRDVVARTMADRWSYVFCDEFQDTDSAQFDLVSSLVGDDNLFVVGDDDQAIYEWRGANPTNITEDITEVFEDLRGEELEANYRSREPILELANEAIQGLEGRGSEKQLEATEARMDTDAGVVTIEEEDKEVEAARLGEVIQRLQEGDTPDLDEQYEYGEMAVLVRDRHHARELIDECDERGIPVELSGSLTAYSQGVETVMSYLRAVADPVNETSLHRVLLLRYRVPDTDLARLHSYDGPLAEALTECDLDAFRFPDRVETAREHLTHLWSVRATHSLSRLYAELKSTTDIEWFLTETERRELTYLDDLISGYANSPVEPSLDSEFIDHLRYSTTTLLESGANDQPDPADDAVTIMTVHQSKGLEFPVVVMPRLTTSGWDVDGRSYASLREAIESGDGTYRDFLAREEREERRVFHVGVTRAEELLVLSGSGSGDETEAQEDSLRSAIHELFPTDGPIRAKKPSFPIWETVMEAAPPSTVDWTELTAEAASARSGEQSNEDADETITAGVRNALDGSLETAPVTVLDLPSDALSTGKQARVLREHSYTAVDRYDTCPRWHFLSNVVYAFEDEPPLASTAGNPPRGDYTAGTDTVSGRIVGNLFHETAEEAAARDDHTRSGWMEIAQDKAEQAGIEAALDRVKRCINNYHDSELADWRLVASERYFRLRLDDDPALERPLIVQGYIDAIYRHQGEYYVVDYKTGGRSESHEFQADIYTLACRELWDYDVDEARIFYVEENEQEIIPRKPIGDDTLRDTVRQKLQRLNENGFGNPTPGDHCRYCPHRNLPCSKYSRADSVSDD